MSKQTSQSTKQIKNSQNLQHRYFCDDYLTMPETLVTLGTGMSMRVCSCIKQKI